MTSAALRILRRDNTVFWNHGTDFKHIFKCVHDAVLQFESQSYLLTDTLILFCKFRQIVDGVRYLNNQSKNHVIAAFDKYLDKLLSEEGICVS